MSQLTAEQQRKIEENRLRALERRAERMGQTPIINNQTSAGPSGTSVQRQPPGRSLASRPAALVQHRDSAPKLYVPLSKHQPQGFNNQKPAWPTHHQSSANGKQINQSRLCNTSPLRQVRWVSVESIMLSHSIIWMTHNLSFTPFAVFPHRSKLSTHFLSHQEVIV